MYHISIENYMYLPHCSAQKSKFLIEQKIANIQLLESIDLSES